METVKRASCPDLKGEEAPKRKCESWFVPTSKCAAHSHWEDTLNDMLVACECVPWQPWQEGIFKLPAKALLLGAGLSVSAPDSFPSPNPRNLFVQWSLYFFPSTRGLWSKLPVHILQLRQAHGRFALRRPSVGIISFSYGSSSVYFVCSLASLGSH